MLRITPIGSCRVARPLQLGEARHGYAIAKDRVYGYCHSSAEALQMVKFLQGDLDIPDHLWPYLSPNRDHQALCAEVHEPSDLYIVELSSAKRLELDGTFIQLNYFNRHFSAFLKSHGRVYWAAITEADQEQIDTLLTRSKVNTEAFSTLRRVRVTGTSPSQLQSDVSEIMARLPRVEFVTHVDALTADGSPIASRSTFHKQVVDAVNYAGGSVYDPTQRMHDVGQSQAMADDSEGLAHFTDNFANTIADDWGKGCLADTFDDVILKSDARRVDQLLAVPLEATKAVERRLDRLAAARPDLSALVAAKAGVTRSVNVLNEQLDTQFRDPKTCPSSTLRLATALERTEDSVRALNALGRTGKLPDRTTLFDLAAQATSVKAFTCARDILFLTLIANPDSQTASARLCETLLNLPDQDIRNVPLAIQELLAPHIEPAQMLDLSGRGQWAYTIEPEILKPEQMHAVADHLTKRKDINRAADLLCRWKETQASTTRLPKPLADVLPLWVHMTMDQQTSVEQVQILRAILRLAPSEPTARNALNHIRSQVRDDMRKALGHDHDQELDRLSHINDLLPNPIKELDLHRARSKFRAQDFLSAADIGSRAAERLPDNLSIWVLLMRTSVKLEDYVSVDACARRVLDICGAENERPAREAKRTWRINAQLCAERAQRDTDPALLRVVRAQAPTFAREKVSAA